MWQVEGNVHKKPYSFVLNTGAWEFDKARVARESQRINATDECDSHEDRVQEAHRTSVEVQSMLNETGALGKQLGVRMIYRSSHYNSRFGINCADGKLIPILKAAQWEVWDNTRISKDVWRTQCGDGFHFDRVHSHTVEDHAQKIAYARENQYESRGMMEMQLAQSILFYIFRDTIMDFIAMNITIPH